MAQEQSLQEQLVIAQDQIQKLFQQLAVEREAARQTEATLQDQIKQQQQRLAQLEAQEIIYRYLFDCNPQPMWLYDLETSRFLAVNNAAVAKYGYSRAEFLTMTLADILPPETSQDLANLLEVNPVDSGLDMACLWRHCLRNGQIIEVEMASYALEIEGRRAELMMPHDVTRRVAAEQALLNLNHSLEQKVFDRTAALATSEARLNLLLNASPATLYSCEPYGDYACTFISNNVQTLLGYNPEEFRSESDFWMQRIHPDDAARVFAEIPELLEQGILKHEYRVRHREGHYVWVRDELTLLRDEAGTPMEVVGFLMDIGDRKQAEIQLRSQLASIEAAVDGIAILEEGKYIYLNRAHLDLFGYTEEELLGQSWTILYGAEELNRMEQEVLPILSRDGSWSGEALGRRKDGTTFNERVSLTVTEIGLLICVCADITDRKQAERELFAYAERVEDLYNNAPCGYCSLDTDSRITGMNNTILIWLDGLRDEVLGQPLTQFMTEASRRIFAEQNTLLAQSGPLHRLHYEITLVGCDGGQMAVLVSQEAQKAPDGRITGSRVTITDIRQRIKAERRLQRQLMQENLLREITARIRQSLDLSTIFQTACNEVRQVLEADRVAIFQFFPGANYDDGEFIAESLGGDYPSVLEVPVHDHCFGENFSNLYAHGLYHAVADIEMGDLTDCHADILRQFQIRANLVVPLVEGKNALWGLLCIHQCSKPRLWQTSEIELTQQLTNQLAIAINQASLYQRLQSELTVRQRAEAQILRQLEQQRTLAKLLETVRESLTVEGVLSAVTQQVKDLLECDRVIIFHLSPDGRSRILEETVSPGFAVLKNMAWEDEVWSEEILKLYWEGRPRIVPDVMQDIWTNCLVEYSQIGQIQSEIVAPILQESYDSEQHRWVDPQVNHKLWGILVAHACREKRVWEEPEAELLQQVASSLAIAIQQTNLFNQLQGELAERKQAEQQLQSATNAAESANQAKSEFLALMSHEIRTPMNAILGLTYLSLEAKPPNPYKDYLGKIQVAGESLLQILNDILDFSKIESGKLEIEIAPFELKDVLHQLSNIFALKAAEKGITLAFVVGEDVPPVLRGDTLRLRQVLMNLISNGIKFTETGSVRVTIAVVEQTSETVRLRFDVEDTGIGITPEQSAKLFAAFTQADLSISRKYGGTGLGLSICKRLVDLMGGTIAIESEINQGSTFYFEIPLGYVPPLSCHLPQSIISQYRAVLTAASVLVVEDNAVNQQIAQELLMSVGVQVDLASTGQMALEKVKIRDYDAILMDIQMPILDGLSATRLIRTLGVTVPIIAMTAHAMISDQEKSLDAGMNDHVSKPINPQELFSTLAKWIAPETNWESISLDLGTDSVSDSVNDVVIDTSETIASDPLDLPQLPGLNVTLGVARFSGEWPIYERILQRFLLSHESTSVELQTALEQNDRDQLSFLIHNLKGSAGNINAEDLFRAVSTLEIEVKNPRVSLSLLAPQILKVSLTLQTLLKTIATLPSPADSPESPKPLGDSLCSDTVRSVLMEVNELVETDFPEAIDRLESLRSQADAILKESIVAISDRLSIFDTDTAKSLLQALMEDLHIPRIKKHY